MDKRNFDIKEVMKIVENYWYNNRESESGNEINYKDFQEESIDIGYGHLFNYGLSHDVGEENH